jgi:proline iminopeptidase
MNGFIFLSIAWLAGCGLLWSGLPAPENGTRGLETDAKIDRNVGARLADSQMPGPGAGEFQKVNSHGLDVRYRIIGRGAPLLVLGGGPGDVSDRYVSLCDLLSKNAQCILVEQRGTGKSTPAVRDASTISVALTLDDFEAIRRRLGLEKWAVLGFSYGGYLASLYAHFFPSSVSSLVLLDSMGLNWEGLQTFMDNVTSRLWASDLEILEYWSDPARMKADPKQAITEIIRARMPGYFFDRGKSLPVRQAVKADDFDFEMGDWIYRDTVDRKLDLAKMEARFRGPTLILHGRQDPGGEKVALGLAAYYKNSRLVFIEKCGHYSYVEQPEKVLLAVVGFLAEK